ncbi:hypothetical protein A2U01_0087416, partial [Trifolium medium]|nr:hypothetical protein [Trifolium medium]
MPPLESVKLTKVRQSRSSKLSVLQLRRAIIQTKERNSFVKEIILLKYTWGATANYSRKRGNLA